MPHKPAEQDADQSQGGQGWVTDEMYQRTGQKGTHHRGHCATGVKKSHRLALTEKREPCCQSGSGNALQRPGDNNQDEACQGNQRPGYGQEKYQQ